MATLSILVSYFIRPAARGRHSEIQINYSSRQAKYLVLLLSRIHYNHMNSSWTESMTFKLHVFQYFQYRSQSSIISFSPDRSSNNSSTPVGDCIDCSWGQFQVRELKKMYTIPSLTTNYRPFVYHSMLPKPLGGGTLKYKWSKSIDGYKTFHSISIKHCSMFSFLT